MDHGILPGAKSSPWDSPMLTSNRSVSVGVSVTSRTAVYGPVRTVGWEGWSREALPYPDLGSRADIHGRRPSIGQRRTATVSAIFKRHQILSNFERSCVGFAGDPAGSQGEKRRVGCAVMNTVALIFGPNIKSKTGSPHVPRRHLFARSSRQMPSARYLSGRCRDASSAP